MPHIEDDWYQVPDPEDINPEEHLPKTPKRRQQPPLADRKTPDKQGGGLLGKYNIKSWNPPNTP